MGIDAASNKERIDDDQELECLRKILAFFSGSTVDSRRDLLDCQQSPQQQSYIGHGKRIENVQ